MKKRLFYFMLSLTVAIGQIHPAVAYASDTTEIVEEYSGNTDENESSSSEVISEEIATSSSSEVISEETATSSSSEVISEETATSSSSEVIFEENAASSDLDGISKEMSLENDEEIIPEEKEQVTYSDKGDFPYITSVYITDVSGNNPEEETFDKEGKISVHYNFSIPGGTGIKAGDVYTIGIPGEIVSV